MHREADLRHVEKTVRWIIQTWCKQVESGQNRPFPSYVARLLTNPRKVLPSLHHSLSDDTVQKKVCSVLNQVFSER